MNTDKLLLRRAVKDALIAGAISASAVVPCAHAADADQSQSANASQSNTAQLGKIEVTGTRIKRTDIETAQPVTIITSKEIKATGLNSVGDILATLPQVRSVLNAQVNNGNDGSSSVDLRNLGSNRVLVLVNGRRWVTNIGTGFVDFGSIPAAVIDHIEILQDGASAIYGSDAISGVVNVITIKNYNGAEANAYVGTYRGDGHTDGKAQAYDFTFGTAGDKGAVVMSVAYTEQNGVLAGDRNISKEPIVGLGVAAAGSSRTPAGRFRIQPIADINGNKAGMCPGQATPTKSGLCDMTLITAPGNGSLSNFRNFDFAKDAYNFAPLNYLVAPTETTNLYVQGHYDLADNLTFTSEGLFNNRSSQTQLAQPVLDVGSATVTPPTIFIDKTNPYNPFGVSLVSNSNAPCIAAKSCDLLVDWGRRYSEAGPRVTTFSQDTYHFSGQFKGYFNMFGGEWDWDAGYELNNQTQTNHESNVVDLHTLGLALGPAFLPAGEKDIPGNFQCGTAAQPIAGCVPANAFGGASGSGQGTLTPAMVQYSTFNPTDTLGETQRDYTANLTGNLLDLPAGPLGLALGGEYLEENGFDHPDTLSILNLNAEGAKQTTDGRERTDAEYVEFSIPILADQPFAKDVNLDLAERWSQFKWVGGTPTSPAAGVTHSDSSQTGRAALKWQTTDSLLLRGSWSQGFRLPQISEFFSNPSASAIAVADPCVAQPTLPNCGGGHTQPNPQINTEVGGSGNLQPEKSISRSVGFVYNPDWLPGFDFSGDYFKIEVDGFIAQLSDATILNSCYRVGASPASPACQAITVRSGTIVNINSFNTNIGGDLTEGVDVSTHYKFPSTSAGDFKLGFDMTFNKLFDRTVPSGSGAFVTSRLAGWATQSGSRAVAYPKRKGDLTLNWNFGPWSAMYQMRYISSIWEACDVVGTSALCSNPTYKVTEEPILQATGRNHLGATVYHDVNVTYHFDSINSDFTLGVRNLFGKVPPISQNAFANSYLPIYDTPGQFLYARLGVKF